MVFKNLLRRKGRTILTVLGIGIGVSAIIILGALAEGVDEGYTSIITGSDADLILSQPAALDITLTAVDEDIIAQLAAMPEVLEVSGYVQGITLTEGSPYFFVFGYPEDSFAIERFRIVEGVSLSDREARAGRGKPILLGAAAAEALTKQVGDSFRLGTSTFRIVGIYETDSAFENGGAVLGLEDAQVLLGRQHQVNLIHIQLKDSELEGRLRTRIERLWPDLSLESSADYADQQIIDEAFSAYIVIIGGMAIVIGGVGMANSQLMAVFERTREIGVLRAVGWTSRQVLRLILGEAMVVGILGGIVGIALGYLGLLSLDAVLLAFGATAGNVTPGLLIQTLFVVFILGLVGGIFPARRASRLKPVEALRYEGGGQGGVKKRLPFGGMAAQSLRQRATRTLLTLGAIALTVGSIMTLEMIIGGATNLLSEFGGGGGGEIVLRQANISDSSQSVIDQRVLDQIEALPGVQSTSGFVWTGLALPETVFFVLEGYNPYEFGIQRFKIIEGKPLTGNHQIILGQQAADATNKGPGDTIDLGGTRFRVVGIYTGVASFEEMGGVVSLRDAQTFAGRPRKVTMANVKVEDPDEAEALVAEINTLFPDVHASLSSEFAEELPDIQTTRSFLGAVSGMAILVGGVGIMNTMLMAVLERTREIGALRALGWRRRGVLGLIIRESLLLGALGGVLGILVSLFFILLLETAPIFGDSIDYVWSPFVFIRAISVALALGLVGGIYPAWRATRLKPVEALRYE